MITTQTIYVLDCGVTLEVNERQTPSKTIRLYDTSQKLGILNYTTTQETAITELEKLISELKTIKI